LVDWQVFVISTGYNSPFKQDCSVLYAAAGETDIAASGDAALAASNYDKAIELYSAAIDLEFVTDTIDANRSKARSGKMLWAMHSSTRKRCDDNCRFVSDAHFGDTQAIELNPSSYFGYQSKHAALHGARRYDEAIETFKTMLSKFENAPGTQTQSTPQITTFLKHA
jgi:tetratricopeptide (TPR) repeat protein